MSPVHDYVIANGTGSAVRSDLNNALAAIVSLNSSSTEPSTTYAYQLWADTNTNTLKLRNSANSAWISLSSTGGIGSANLGLATLASPSFTGDVSFAGDINMTGTGAIDVAAGTTAQRPSTPSAGMIRYNTTTGSFEGYSTAWGEIGGGGGAVGGGNDTIFWENGQTVTTDYEITNGKNAGSFGPISIDSAATVTIGDGEVWTIV